MKRRSEQEANGKRYGKLMVVGVADKTVCGKVRLSCLCDCGSSVVAVKNNLVRGKTTSCGCVHSDLVSVRMRARSPKDAAAFGHYRSYRTRAEKSGVPFDISEDEFREIASSECWYCGRPPKEKVGKLFGEEHYTGYFYNGLDRFDNGLGYEKDNVVPCCIMCNIAKNKFSYEEFIGMCARVANRHCTPETGEQEVCHGG